MNLRGVGLTAAEDEAYRLLVAAGATDIDHLATLIGRPTPETVATVSALRDKGLVSQPGDNPSSVVAAPPDVALAPLIMRGQEALAGATRLAAELSEQHRANARRHDATQLVEVVTGVGAIRQALRTLQLSTREELLWFCRAGHVAMASGENDEEYAMLARGVKYQVIYEHAMLEEDGVLQAVARGVAAGEEARAVPLLPVRMAIADRTLALCPLVTVQDGRSVPTAAIVRDSNLLTALIALFDIYWSAGSPLLPAGSSGEPAGIETPDSTVGAEERELLSLLVAGVTDKAIATRLGVSTRTVQRRISDLMELTGAKSRMQLAWQVAQRNWLLGFDPPPEAAQSEPMP